MSRKTFGQQWQEEHGEPFPEAEATNRSMCRILGGARASDGGVTLSFEPATFEAIFLELEAKAPCGVCRRDVCLGAEPAA